MAMRYDGLSYRCFFLEERGRAGLGGETGVSKVPPTGLGLHVRAGVVVLI